MDLYYLAELMGLEATIDGAKTMREYLVSRGIWQYTDDVPENEWFNLCSYSVNIGILDTIETLHGTTAREEAEELMHSVYNS